MTADAQATDRDAQREAFLQRQDELDAKHEYFGHTTETIWIDGYNIGRAEGEQCDHLPAQAADIAAQQARTERTAEIVAWLRALQNDVVAWSVKHADAFRWLADQLEVRHDAD